MHPTSEPSGNAPLTPRPTTTRGARKETLVALVEPTASYSLSRRGWIIAAIVLLLALLPPLFLPIGPDEGIFLSSGRKILQGAVHYRDIIDVKPPAIYYIYATATAIFGPSDIGLHIFDLLMQGLTVWWIITLLRRATGNDLTAVMAAFWYAIFYSGMRLGCEMQAESYCGLLTIPIIWLLLYRRTAVGFFIVGLLTGALFMLKFTLGGVLVVVVASEWIFHRREGELLKHYAEVAAGFAVVIGLFVLYLVGLDALRGFLQVQQFISGYGTVENASPIRWAAAFAAWAPPYLLRHFSLLFVVAVGIGLTVSFRKGRASAPGEEPEYLLRFCALAFILLFGTVSLEGRYYVYHFSRLYPFAAILGTFGSAHLLRWMLEIAARSRPWRIGIYAAVPVLLILSPLNRYVWQIIPVAREIGHGRFSLAEIYDQWGHVYPRQELKQIGDTIRHLRRPGDELFAASTFAGLAHVFADDVPAFKIYHTAFIIAPFAPDQWRDTTAYYLLHERPRFIISQRDDPIYTITASNRTSEEALLALPGIDSLLRSDYHLLLNTKQFRLFERTE